MADRIERRYDQGTVTSRDRAELQPGETQQSTGFHYLPGDPRRLHKMGGRSEFGDTASAAVIKGLGLATYDDGTAKVLAFTGTDIYEATAGASGTFAAAGQSITGNRMDMAHANDRWYMCFGGASGQKNLFRESDGTYYTHGMVAPQQAMTAAPASKTSNIYPSEASGFNNNANAYDGVMATFAGGTLAAAGSTTFTVTAWDTVTTLSHFLAVYWSLGGLPPEGYDWENSIGDTGIGVNSGYNVTLKFEYTENADAGTPTWTEFYNATFESAQALQATQIGITNGLAAATKVRFRATITYNSGTNTATLRIHEVVLRSGGAVSDFSTTTGLYYARTEYDQVRGEESVRSPLTGLVELSTQNHVVLSWSESAQNSRSTHWRIYRTADGGTETQLGLIGQIPILSSSYLDDFAKYNHLQQPAQPFPMIAVSSSGATTYYPRDSEPPTMRRMGFFEGSLWGLTDFNKRALYYSIPGRPGSWPEIYNFDKFPFEEWDELVDCIQVGTSLVIGAKGLMIRLDELPRAYSGVFDSNPTPISGAPGCVGEYAMTKLALDGQQYAGWISYDGVYVTNGHTFDCISNDFDFSALGDYDKSTWVLHWDQERRVLVFAYSSSGAATNNRFLLFHLDKTHRKQNGMPKITGPHYGNIYCMASGQVSGEYRLYSGHGSDGSVYLENNEDTGADASQAYSGTQHPGIITGRRSYAEGYAYSALTAALYHSDFGTGETCEVAWTAGRDSNDYSNTKTKTVQLDGQKKDRFVIDRAGEWHEETITHSGTGLGSITGMFVDAVRLGEEGDVLVVP